MYTNRNQKITKEQYKELLSHFRDLEDGWYYGALPISEKALDAVCTFLANTAVVPGVNGDLQIEWHACGYDIELSFNADGEIDDIGVEKAGFRLFDDTNRSVSFKEGSDSDVEIIFDRNGNFGAFDLYMGGL